LCAQLTRDLFAIAKFLYIYNSYQRVCHKTQHCTSAHLATCLTSHAICSVTDLDLRLTILNRLKLYRYTCTFIFSFFSFLYLLYYVLSTITMTNKLYHIAEL